MILHLDMDYFFAQVEERENPRFKGKPLIVGADPKKGEGRGVVSTCNYKAREFGVSSGMAISKAYNLCSQAVFLPVDKELYKRVSNNIFKLIMEEVDCPYEKVSLDEIYLDLKEVFEDWSKAKRLAKKLRNKIFEKEDLTCSIGVGPNKMIAKLACEENKPDGLKVVYPDEVKKFLTTKGVEKVPGVGPKTKSELERILKISNPTIEEVREISKKRLVDEFGKKGKKLHDKFQGRDNSRVKTKTEKKSVGREITFDKNTTDSEKIINTFKELSKEVAELASREDKKIKTVVAVCRFEGFNSYTRQRTYPAFLPDKEVIYKRGVKLLMRLIASNGKPVRLLGLRVKFTNSG